MEISLSLQMHEIRLQSLVSNKVLLFFLFVKFIFEHHFPKSILCSIDKNLLKHRHL